MKNKVINRFRPMLERSRSAGTLSDRPGLQRRRIRRPGRRCSGEDVGVAVDAGAVNVIYGSAAGLTATGNPRHQNSAGVVDGRTWGSKFGGAGLGRLQWRRFDDLAVGVPTRDVGAVADAGAVNVLYGSPWA